MNLCPNCGLVLLQDHQCAPVWKVRIPSWSPTGTVEVRTFQPSTAAEIAVKDIEPEDFSGFIIAYVEVEGTWEAYDVLVSRSTFYLATKRV